MKFKCPCCNCCTMLHEDPVYHDICPVCFWENDPIQNMNTSFVGGANEICLDDARNNYIEFGAVSKKLIKFVRPPKNDEK